MQNARARLIAVVVGLVSLASVRDASAHRLDEYLQATRVDIDADHVGIEIDLTPGANIASDVLGWIDTNLDGIISTAEADAYINAVFRDVTLTVDGVRTPMTVVSRELPSWDAVRLGTGSIRLRAIANVASSSGEHRLALVNAHRPAESVYLANVLVPEDARVRIEQQRHDPLQREFEMNYTVTRRGASLVWLLGGAAMLGCLGIIRRRRS